jgi:acylglycerol lipase
VFVFFAFFFLFFPKGYYQEIAAEMNKIGLATFALDHVGHGHSEGERMYVEDVDHLVEDVLYYSAMLKEQYKDVPMFLYGKKFCIW